MPIDRLQRAVAKMAISASDKRPAMVEVAPLRRHMSLDDYLHLEEHKSKVRKAKLQRYAIALLVALGAITAIVVHRRRAPKPPTPLPTIVPIENAKEQMLDIGHGLSLWFRTWGNRDSGVPVLFVHGGPGNCIADYGHFNSKFFAADLYFVVEVDQRGTGQSTPSVRDKCANMALYKDISIDKMSHDFELLRGALGIEKWLVFGGSWGSTLGLNYAQRYPRRCLGLILRGIYLNTKEEFDAVFSRDPYLHNPKRLAEFDAWFKLAAQDVRKAGEPKLDPNDSERFFRVYERMIERCDRAAIWHYTVFENNLIEEEPSKLLDPKKILESKFAEAQSVAFFETRLFLHGTFEEPVNLLEKVDRLKSSAPVHTWICQGHRDEVCPEKYARKLVDALQLAGVPHKSHFIDAGHEASDPVMTKCLKVALDDFLKYAP